MRSLMFAMGAVVALSMNARGDSMVDRVRKFILSFAPPEEETISPHVYGTPLPSWPGAVSEKEFRKVYLGWLNRTIVGHYPAEKDAKGGAFIGASMKYLAENSNFDPAAELKSEEQGFDLQTVNEPGLLFTIGVIDGPTARGLAAFDKALTLFPGSSYPKFIWCLAAANAGRAAHSLNANAEQLKGRDELTLKYLEGGLGDGSFVSSEMAALRWRFDAGSFQDLLSRNGPRVADVIDTAPKVDPWVKEYVKGYEFVEEAWQSRGADWANKVTPEGWHGFAESLALARTHLVESWTENPHDPAAAAEMVEVCMGESEAKDTMRTWFDRSVAADFDFMPAYNHLRWGLRPRWLGNAAELTVFGRECASTGRYDTCVPDERVAVALDICEDSADHGAPLENEQTAGEVLGVLDKYLEQADAPIDTALAHTLWAIVAHKSGRMDEAKRQLAAIGFKPVRTRVTMELDDLPELVRVAEGGK